MSCTKEDEVEIFEEEQLAVEGRHLNCIIHRLCLTPKADNTERWNNLFRTRGAIKGRTVDIIINNGSTDNLISAKTVAALKLPTEKHTKRYQLGWIKYGDAVNVKQQCQVPLSTGKHYVDKVLCDVIPMDATHLLLGRPWQLNMVVTYRDKLNQYVIQVRDRRIVLLPLAPKPIKEMEKPNVLVQNKAEFVQPTGGKRFGIDCSRDWGGNSEVITGIPTDHWKVR